MQYREFGKTGEKVSALGFGCMRLPTLGNLTRSIDEPQAVRMIRNGIGNGINYIDTAFFYHEGRSEGLVGKALENGYRNKVLLATKSPFTGFKLGVEFDRILDTQLKRLKTDHIDMYLLHAANLKAWKNSALKFDLLSKMERAREQGKIRYIGFSFHDNLDAFMTILNGYDHWDFCQIQYNYVDIDHQAGTKGLEAAAAKGLGVIVMEPLFGGKLASPTDNVRAALPAGVSPVQAALDFVWDRPEVSLLLSGMGSAQQVEDNIRYASESRPGKLTEEQKACYIKAKTVFEHSARVNCTHCEYCMPCPAGVEIPEIFAQYNKSVTDADAAKKQYKKIKGTVQKCVSCGQCENKCPQQLPIRELLHEADTFFKEKKA